MKVKEVNQKMVFLMCMGRNKKLITVAQYDSPEWETGNNINPETAWHRPIYVEYGGMQESILDVLEERDNLKLKVKDLESQIKRNYHGELDELKSRMNELTSRKWYQFWR